LGGKGGIGGRRDQISTTASQKARVQDHPKKKGGDAGVKSSKKPPETNGNENADLGTDPQKGKERIEGRFRRNHKFHPKRPESGNVRSIERSVFKEKRGMPG